MVVENRSSVNVGKVKIYPHLSTRMYRKYSAAFVILRAPHYQSTLFRPAPLRRPVGRSDKHNCRLPKNMCLEHVKLLQVHI